MRELHELIDLAAPGWPLVQEWVAEATNPVEVLPPPDDATRGRALADTQVTTRSPMGAVIYETPGPFNEQSRIQRIRLVRAGILHHAEQNHSMKHPSLSFWLIAGLLAFLAPCWADTKIVLPDPDLFADAQDEYFVTTTIPGDFTTVESLVSALLSQADAAKNKKLTRPFVPKMLESTSQFEGAKPLATYFKGTRMRGKNVILSFTGEAMRYLNTTSAIQGFVKGAIEETIQLNFADVKEVLYEIDGKIVREWDA